MNLHCAIFLITIVISAAACNLPSAKVRNTLGDKADVKNGKRSKLIIQKEKKNTETGVYMQDLELREPLMVDGKPDKGKHRFEIGINGNYFGEKRSCEPIRYALIILHEKPVKTGWQYPSNANVIWAIDGKETKPEKIIQRPIEKEDGEWWESLITRPDCETFRQMASATSAEIRINNAVIKLQPDEIAALKEYAVAIGF